MTASLLLRCGCVVPFQDGKEPRCPAHGRQAVVRTMGMPAPTFRGLVTGPHARTADLSAWSGKLQE